MLKENVDSTSISRSSEKQSTSIQHQNKASIPSASTQDPTHPPILDHRKEGNDFFESARHGVSILHRLSETDKRFRHIAFIISRTTH